MNASKIKSAFLLILLAVNLFFFFSARNYLKRRNEFTDRELREAAEVLNKSGIKVTDGVIPNVKAGEVVYEVPCDYAGNPDIVRRFLRDEIAGYSTPEGVTYTTGNESLILRNDHSFLYAAFPLSPDEYLNAAAALAEGSVSPTGAQISAVREKEIKRLFSVRSGGKTVLEASCSAAYQIGEYEYFFVTQKINGKPIRFAPLIAAFSGDRLVAAGGSAIFYLPVKEYRHDIIDSINILFLIPKSDETIINIDVVLYPVYHKDDYLCLLPSYEFTYENGGVAVYDATSATKR